jgi:hypothetical protein
MKKAAAQMIHVKQDLGQIYKNYPLWNWTTYEEEPASFKKLG